MYNANATQKDAGTSSHLSVGQSAYDSRYGGSQVSPLHLLESDSLQVLNCFFSELCCI
jgi:hypothetical protein